MKGLLDLDGVIVDFIGGMCRAHDRPNPYRQPSSGGCYELHAIWGMSATDFWKPADASFWHGLEMLPDGQRILSACVNHFGTENICLLTSPSINEGATDGKIRWIYKHLPAFKRQFLVGAAKEFCAHDNAVLVDDWDGNIEKFRANGGRTIHVPRPWNSRHLHAYKAASVVEQELRDLQHTKGSDE